MFVKSNNIVYQFAHGGDTGRALDWAERALAVRDHEVAYWGALLHPVHVLHDQPRFRALLQELGLPGAAGVR